MLSKKILASITKEIEKKKELVAKLDTKKATTLAEIDSLTKLKADSEAELAAAEKAAVKVTEVKAPEKAADKPAPAPAAAAAKAPEQKKA